MFLFGQYCYQFDFDFLESSPNTIIMGVPSEALISLALSIARQLAPILQWWRLAFGIKI